LLSLLKLLGVKHQHSPKTEVPKVTEVFYALSIFCKNKLKYTKLWTHWILWNRTNADSSNRNPQDMCRVPVYFIGYIYTHGLDHI